MATRREDRYATGTEVAEALRTVAGCELPPPDAGRSNPVAAAATGGNAPIRVESPTQSEDRSSRSTSMCPAVATDWWLRLLTRLSEWSPWVVLLSGLAALLATFISGFLLASTLP